LWQAAGVNLRARKAVLIVVVDEAPPSLERIFRFLAESSDLDVRLFTVERYDSKAGVIFVSQNRVDRRSEPGARRAAAALEFGPELDAAAQEYNKQPFEGIQAVGGVKYAARDFEGKTLATGLEPLKWYESPASDKSNLFVDLPLSTPPQTIAAALKELLSITKEQMAAAIHQFSAAKAAGA
jgi:hypothetical protein